MAKGHAQQNHTVFLSLSLLLRSCGLGIGSRKATAACFIGYNENGGDGESLTTVIAAPLCSRPLRPSLYWLAAWIRSLTHNWPSAGLCKWGKVAVPTNTGSKACPSAASLLVAATIWQLQLKNICCSKVHTMQSYKSCIFRDIRKCEFRRDITFCNILRAALQRQNQLSFNKTCFLLLQSCLPCIYIYILYIFHNFFIFYFYSISLSLVGNLGHLTQVWQSSCKSSTTHSYQCV